jgi:aerobic-type carbon monoxide dehydrogenase small subunit (CoxS/CutS family)
MRKTIHVTLNGQPQSPVLERERMLLWVLRTDFGLTGTTYGCGEGLWREFLRLMGGGLFVFFSLGIP